MKRSWTAWVRLAIAADSSWDWPPDVWSRRPNEDDTLIHPAVLAATIWAKAD
jgi:hypothetical protein